MKDEGNVKGVGWRVGLGGKEVWGEKMRRRCGVRNEGNVKGVG